MFSNKSFDPPSAEDGLSSGWVILLASHTDVVQQLIPLSNPQATLWSRFGAWSKQKHEIQDASKKSWLFGKEGMTRMSGRRESLCLKRPQNLNFTKKTTKTRQKTIWNHPTVIKWQVPTLQLSVAI